MERLTLLLGKLDKEVCGSKGLYSCYYNRLHNCCEVIDSIQEELGIPLEVLFKAFKSKIHLKKYGSFAFVVERLAMDLKDNLCFVLVSDRDAYKVEQVKLKDYGKTWALTREELEND